MWSKKSRQERGYGYEWEKLRKTILERDGNLCKCEECARLSRVRLATHVDHKIRKEDGGTDDPSNLQALNEECHKRKTTIENGGIPKPKVMIGLDGFPIGTR